ncbi:phage head morphogenesis protein, SPP1 gp7 family [Oleidesulfovibrio alaskensis G20]|jgi:SPP1 gp7 family putative phage head morphogenesis protein|uniref:Phage head morphogenesis protein, SPP1 gp7 family n=1 Tax=Oleidesulfovibrio alaskensis (strain ATCC BAA-1058 / DSM 17464 / G20) TaxID=207559 RepID=Q30VX8_OLEA2|nr:PBECR2 nuclease fold domain-containing protein [Oleidesulfovibrio alaskensis]ABB40168.1 phage head morphogenesis protein, SPP1 gp7 family [Oleidesulfovibrio alaskensis G20]MBL3587964.1 minor capsid protein [bacterium]
MTVEPVALPPKEALAYWQDKVSVTPEVFKNLSGQARARAFAVSGLSRQDQIAAVQQAVHEAMANGETLKDFKGRMDAVLEGARLPRWRLENIYRTNVQSAYMAGRYAQMQRTTALRPYWRYVAVADKRTRPDHLALHGLVYPHDHKFWSTYYPPNGFACRCTVQTLSERQAKQSGVEIQKDMPDLIEPVDPRTGNRLPARRPVPDAGFAGNVGQDWLHGLAPSELDAKIKDLPLPTLCRTGGTSFADPQAGAPCRPPLASLAKRHILPVTAKDILPGGLKAEEYVAAFLKEFNLADINASAVHTIPGGIPVVIGKGLFIDKKTGGWKVLKSGREQYLKLLARTVKEPWEVWQVPAEVAGKPMPVLRLIRLFRDEEEARIGGFAVFNLVRGREWQGATTFTPKLGNEAAMLKYMERQRQGALLYREP